MAVASGAPGPTGTTGTKETAVAPGVPGDLVPQDLARYLAASTGLPQATAVRVIADVNAYYDEAVEDYVRRRHAELRRRNRKNDDIWPQIAAELAHRRFRAPDLTDRQLRRLIYG